MTDQPDEHQPDEQVTEVHPEEPADVHPDELPGDVDTGHVDDGHHAGAEVSDPRIAAAVARLDGLAEQPPVEHVEVYEEVHRVLQDSLADASRASDTRDRPTDGPGERPGGPHP